MNCCRQAHCGFFVKVHTVFDMAELLMGRKEENKSVINLSYLEKFYQDIAPYNPRFIEERGSVLAEIRSKPKHVFPVVDSESDSGLMVPFTIKRAITWHISDAFGRFAGKNKDSSVWESFTCLIGLIQKEFSKTLGETQPIAPILFRYAFDISLSVPVHLETIGGRSLQLPLIVALCREIAEQSQEGSGFLKGPVFSSGELCERSVCPGSLLPVNKIIQKAQGFVREYGPRRSAILPRCHQTDMEKAGVDKFFSSIIYIASVSELVEKIPGLKTSLLALPHITEMNRLIQEMQRRRTALNFGDAALFQNWLKGFPGNSGISDYHRVQIHLAEMQLLNSQGYVLSAAKVATQITKSFYISRSEKGLSLGRESCLQFQTEQANNALARLDAEEAISFLDEHLKHLNDVAPALRAHFQATYGRSLYFLGKVDEAQYFYKQAIATADFGNTDYSGQYRNYLVHTWLRKAETAYGVEKDTFLEEAERLLTESERSFAPRTTEIAFKSHALFCERLHTQIAWLRREAYEPTVAESSPYQQVLIYMYFNCARNKAHPLETRLAYCERIRHPRSSRVVGKADQINHVTFLRGITRLYYHALQDDQEELARWRKGLLRTSVLLKRNDFPGWHTLFATHLPCSRINVDDIEKLAEAVPFF